MHSSMFIYIFSLISVIIYAKHHSDVITLATWNIGLEEQLATERTSSIINAIRKKNADIVCLQEAWGGPLILRQIYQSLKHVYPYYEIVDDRMRNYISSKRLPTQTYNPACIPKNITSAQLCLATYCSASRDIELLICAMIKCPINFLALYTNSKCWACIFERFISRQDPSALNYCGAIILPKLNNTSSGIIHISTEEPWDHTIGLMILAKRGYPLKKLAANLFSEYYLFPRGYIIVSVENKQLIISNTHVATVETPFPHAPKGTFFNNKYGSWNEENKGQTIELESIVWNLFRNNRRKYKNAIMAGDFNMGIANSEHNVLALQADSWNYIHQLIDTDGSRRWYDDYTEMHRLCTRCTDNLVVHFPVNYIYDHIFTHGNMFHSCDLFTRRIFDNRVTISTRNGTIITSLSDHYAANLFSEYYLFPRGYIIVSVENKQLIISNTHVATVETPFPHAPKGTFFNNKYGSWNEENKGQTIELESIVWNLFRNNRRKYKNAIMAGDFNMGIANVEHNVLALQADSWNYIHQLIDTDGSRRWYDDYTEMHRLCTRCTDNLVVHFPVNYIYDHIFTHGNMFHSCDLFTRRIFDNRVTISTRNGTIITSLSDHYGVELIVAC
ncbi:unnamed protein product [Rotaria sp. Silwood1]|nr:unnamed protein product [Rotaria sp. Silwood1]